MRILLLDIAEKLRMQITGYLNYNIYYNRI